MNCRSQMLLAFLLPLFPIDQSLASQYQLLIDNDTPTSGTVRLVLDGALEADTTFGARHMGKSYVEKPVCVTSGKELVRRESGWIARAGCSEISWNTGFTETSHPIHEVSAQINLYYPGEWWLFSEWGNLLRPEQEVGESEICAESETVKTCRSVPTAEEPPLLMLIGESTNRINFDGTAFNFFTGHQPNDFDVAGLYGSYERQLSYLHALLSGTTGTPPPDVVDVLLLGIDRARGVAGGAAGNASYLANVAVSGNQVDPQERTRLLWISGHELAHMLGLGTEALWASESLAHYYGFKSLGESKDASDRFDQMIKNTGQMGLLEAHSRVTQEGERQHYPQFYTRGASFWKEIDEAISEATQGDRSLDSFLPLLVNGDFGPNGELPTEFVEVAKQSAGREKFERICQEYL